MKKSAVTAAVFVLLLSACAQPPTRATAAGPLPFDRKNPNVYVVGGQYIVVDQEPIVFLKGDKGRITWHLKDPDYRFDPGSGISGIKVLSGKHNDIKDCRLEDPSRFSCQNDNTGPGTYKYSIVITRKKDNKQLPILDPTIGND